MEIVLRMSCPMYGLPVSDQSGTYKVSAMKRKGHHSATTVFGSSIRSDGIRYSRLHFQIVNSSAFPPPCSHALSPGD